jgi:hypothetical protein
MPETSKQTILGKRLRRALRVDDMFSETDFE